MPEKYKGRLMEIIYQDQDSKITQRKVRVKSIRNDFIRAIDSSTGRWRTFNISGILAWQPVEGTA